ncbi:SEC-C metal-binding domain-containing protein [Cohnella lubricantis]
MMSKLNEQNRLQLAGRSAMDEAAKRANRQAEKEEEKRWAAIDPSISLLEALGRLSKQELTAIRIKWNVTGASSLNKNDLADKLASSMTERLPELLRLFDEERYQVVKTAADRSDALPALEFPSDVRYFMECGLLFPGTVDGKRVMIMPREVKEFFRGFDSSALRSAVRDNSRLVRLVMGLLAYYGVLRAEELSAKLGVHVKEVPAAQELDRLLAEREDYAAGWQRGDYGYADEAVGEPEQLLAEHEGRKEIPYYPFKTEQLLQAGVPDFVERGISFRSFVRFITTNYSIAEEDADEIVTELTWDIQNGAMPSAMMEALQDRFEMADEAIAAGFIAHLTALNNNTRLWALKGHTPAELSAARAAGSQRGAGAAGGMAAGAGAGAGAAGVAGVAGGKAVSIAGSRKIGRNDPCPCGSGKKYKKCCGANA